MNLIFFDLETGGLTEEHPDIQIAAIATQSVSGSELKEIDVFEAKITFDPDSCDPKALKLNSYDRETWEKESIDEEDAVRDFGDFLRRHCDLPMISKRGKRYHVARLAGHNVARFDCPRLQAMFKRYGAFLPADSYRPLDTMQLALWRAFNAGDQPENFKLGSLCKWLDIEVKDAHDALGDVRLTVQLARLLLAS